MAVPKRRTSHSRQGKRRSHHHLTPVQIQYCPRCEQPILPHRVCSNCGWSNAQDREVPRQDEWSCTFAGVPWQSHQWLAQIVMAGLHAVGGLDALVVGTAAVLAAISNSTTA